MSELRIVTNNIPRDILYWYDLTEKERREFDYLDTEERQSDATFFRYRGATYDLGEFMRIDVNAPESMKQWHGYSSDSYFSGVLVRYVENFERVICALYLS